ncbi:hypothetical protein BGZ61DRAFT_240210 [Ilyonectria robusta]|uniref:uncharacterized protein n=1 Tax=Ilyonectria robusta TaxID=1079257 RepID=UPI001E8E39E3|nr:uncharacterized protein BGZ61DRAFT_240210 [Ilyonectria robusta]KAH8699945.1 hypothetical protein BGZ61DRAFT_240210 [Ilyonectria robusta]
MASLKNIMNTEDDHVDSPSGPIPHDSDPRQPLRSDSSASASTYPTTRDRPASTASYNSMLDPTRHSRFIIAETSSSSSSAGTISARRRSNASIDSTESPYGPGYSIPPSNSPMRPFPTNMGGSEPRVKLTPITRKISKAKKGVPVHNCDQCPKTFTRAEHLRRHQLSHAAPDLRCHVPNCGKTFFRKDLLDRHVQRHEQDDNPKDSKSSSRRRSSKGSNHPYPPSGLQMPEAFAGHRPNPSGDLPVTPGMTPGNWQAMATVPNTGQNHTPSPHIMDSNDDYPMGNVSKDYILDTPMSNLQTTAESFMPGLYSQPRDMPELPLLFIPDNAPAAPSWQDNQTMPSSASESTYSTPSDNSRRHRFPVRTSSGDWNTHAPYQAATNETRSTGLDTGGYLPFTYSASPPMYQQLYGDSMGLPLPGYEDSTLIFDPDQIQVTTVRSLSPQMAVAQSSETLVTFPSAPTSDHILNGNICGRPPAEGLGILDAREMMPVSLTRDIRDMVPTYLNVYWDKVHPLYPIVHKPSFENVSGAAEEHADVRRCAMAAIATQFLADKDHRMKGAQLHAYAWYKSKFTQLDEWSLPVKQTVLLCEYYARFRGRRKESYKPSSRFGLLYQRVFNSQNAFVPIPAEHEAMQQWAVWIDMETRRRLLAACFLLDVHCARYHEQRHMSVAGLDYSFPRRLPIPLSSSTAPLWEASTFQDWSVLRTTSNPTMLRDLNLDALTSSDIASAPPFDGAILLSAYVLYLPGRHTLTQPEIVEDAATAQIEGILARLFPTSAIANTYMALHYTPLRYLLSVSGDSWVFNEKVTEAKSFSQHQDRLDQWRKSGSAAIATVFAARALKAFLGLDSGPEGSGDGVGKPQRRQCAFWKDISDYWGVYVCALICWAFGDIGKRSQATGPAAQKAAMQWIMTVSEMDPPEVQNLSDRHGAYEVVSLARAELAADCLGGRNILFADAAGVLEKLEHGDNWKWF